MPATMSEEPVLSPRELEVLELVAQGATNQEIARELHISPNTVKVHLRNIYEKLGVSSRTEASMVGLRDGLITLPGSKQPAESPDAETTPPPDAAPASETVSPIVSEPPAAASEMAADATAPASTTEAPPVVRPRERAWTQWIVGGGVVAVMLLLMVVMWRLFQPSAEEQPATVFVSAEQLVQRWVALQPMPAPLADMAATPTDRFLALVGGESENGMTSAFWLYDAQADTWQESVAAPLALRHAQSAWLGGRLYLAGGETADGSVSDAVWVYTPDTETWEQGAPLPTPRSRGAMVAFEGALYLIGGWDGAQAQATIWRYSPDEDAWTETATLEEARLFPAAAVTRQGLFVYGGETPDGAPTDEGWQIRKDGTQLLLEPVRPLPVPMARLSAAVLAETLYFFDGKGIWHSNPNTQEWTYIPLPEGQAQIGGAFLAADPYLYIMGGRDTDGRLTSTVWRYTALFRTFAPIVPGGQ
ncbi:MAG: hypothetical protein D6802_02450 [Ardenticatenia bacterium]|nr:MAG: hypothetical protein D6802_02450 [Ardenticatenia bacterium]